MALANGLPPPSLAAILNCIILAAICRAVYLLWRNQIHSTDIDCQLQLLVAHIANASSMAASPIGLTNYLTFDTVWSCLTLFCSMH